MTAIAVNGLARPNATIPAFKVATAVVIPLTAVAIATNFACQRPQELPMPQQQQCRCFSQLLEKIANFWQELNKVRRYLPNEFGESCLELSTYRNQRCANISLHILNGY